MWEMERKHQLVLLLVAALVLFVAGYKYAQVRENPVEQGLVIDYAGDAAGETGAGEGIGDAAGEVVVHVAGEVKSPGVFHLPAGSRVVDAVNMAGPTGDSALDYLNLAAPLHDGSQIIVYSRSEMARQTTGGGAGTITTVPGFTGPGGSTGGRININTAGQAELEELPGIGPALAQRIIDHRTRNGPFLSTEDIMTVSGIGEKRYEQLKDLITVH